ncbi:MAG: SpoIIE family protein phosphatase [Terriglobia bacterium]
MSASGARLVVQDASENGREVEIAQTPFTLGRQGDNDLVLLDNRISRRHARIVRDPRGYVLEDIASRHGTHVNGERVDRCLLHDGDRIGLGVTSAYRLTFRCEPSGLASFLEEIEKAPDTPAPRLQHLNLLLQVAQMLHRAAALDEILTTVVDSALQLFDAERGILFLADDAGEPRLRIARTRSGANPVLHDSDGAFAVVRRVMETRREEVILEEFGDGRTAFGTATRYGGRPGILALPLQKLPMAEGGGETVRHASPKLLGALYLESRGETAMMTRLDRQALDTLAVESAMVIENASLIREAREQERHRHDMAVARTIQQSLLPHTLPQAAHFRIHAVTTPCRTVGGDYYDVVSLPGGRVGLVVADVSGKGLPAAMMSMTLQGAFSALAAADLPLEELFRRVNGFLYERTPQEMYATLFYGVLDPEGRFQFVNAGHVPPFVLRAGGTVEAVDSPNFPLGMFEEATFDVASVQLHPGEQVLIFSDGLTEAHNEALEMLGEARVQEVLLAAASQRSAPAEVCAKLVRAAESFVGSAPQADDVTVALLQFGPQ